MSISMRHRNLDDQEISHRHSFGVNVSNVAIQNLTEASALLTAAGEAAGIFIQDEDLGNLHTSPSARLEIEIRAADNP